MQYDLIILDVNLPIIDGFTVLKNIRRENKEIPVLILSALDEIEDKVKGLDLGANDYLTKPFHFAALEARVRSLLRRKIVIENPVLTHGSLNRQIPIQKGEQRRFDFQLHITPLKPYDYKKAFSVRYDHNSKLKDEYKEIDRAAKHGLDYVTFHQGNMIMPYINYPFYEVDRLKKPCSMPIIKI